MFREFSSIWEIQVYSCLRYPYCGVLYDSSLKSRRLIVQLKYLAGLASAIEVDPENWTGS